jgi:small-conductance mechanosensitive channel
LVKVANFIHTRGKLVQIVVTFLILDITIIWCHFFTKLTGVGGKCTAGSLLTFLLYFVTFYLLFYSSYILRRWLQTTRQTTSSTTSLIAPEEARSAAILGTTNRRCLYMCSLWTCMDMILSIDVMLCVDVMNIVMFE